MPFCDLCYVLGNMSIKSDWPLLSYCVTFDACFVSQLLDVDIFCRHTDCCSYCFALPVKFGASRMTEGDMFGAGY